MGGPNAGSGRSTPHAGSSQLQLVNKIPNILPHERVFPIQIGSELFKLSGASISSDGTFCPLHLPAARRVSANCNAAPSYFSQYFICQIERAKEAGEDLSTAIRTLYIDRDPVTFTDISLHLQGYHVQPRDGTHFVRLFADAQFYSRKTNTHYYHPSHYSSLLTYDPDAPSSAQAHIAAVR